MPNESDKIEEELNELDILVDRFRDGVNRCDISSIATSSKTISSRIKTLRSNLDTMKEKQKSFLTYLDIESSKQFDRLSKGRCACSMVKSI
jgi:hypothetical protein